MKIEELKEKCPNLFEELENSPSLSIDEIKAKETKKDEEEIDIHKTRFPSVVDHLLGCKTDEEAKKIIEYFEKRDEIDPQLAKKMKEQIKKKGVRSFGEKREKGEIEKNGLDY
ncbi:DUF2095 domain-containing protein [archaeon SCG-AAA382B04]|nr:DUF2095 domain-containing protein [archaeon SCG-AAA382B04]